MTNSSSQKRPVGFEIRTFDEKGNSIDCAALEGLGQLITVEEVEAFADREHDEDAKQSICVIDSTGDFVGAGLVVSDVDSLVRWMKKNLKTINNATRVYNKGA